MIIPSHIRIALASLRSTRIRTALTTLGIVIGVASITLVLALGEGARQAINQQIVDLDQGIIMVRSGQAIEQDALSAYNPFTVTAGSNLTEQDATSIAGLPGSEATAPLMVLGGSVKSGDRTIEASPIVATSPALPEVLQLKLRSGQFHDPTTDRTTVVLGERLAIDLLGTNQARSQEVIIKGRPHTVIGVLRSSTKPINIIGVNLDNAAYLNLAAGKELNQGVAQIQRIIVKTPAGENTGPLAARIDNTILANHRGERDFSVLEGAHADQGANAFYNTIVAVTAGVAGVALIVGGVGIMNVMLVSVTERTREIGIRKALGATDRQIMIQFLIEALIMTVSGGIIGLLLAYGTAYSISAFFDFRPAVNWQIIGLALGLAVSVGVIFGSFPALRASKKDPITALRQYQ